MMRILALVASLSVASAKGLAWPVPDIFEPHADPCTGVKLPAKTPPACYTGGASIMGGALKEDIVLKIDTFDMTSRAGTVDIRATGASPEACGKLPFSIDGANNVVFGTDPATCLSGTKVTAKYCSDQDKIQLHVAIPHFPIASLPVDLTTTKCP